MRTTFILFSIVALLGACSPAKHSGTSAPKDQLSDVQRADVTHTFINANREKILGNRNEAAALFSEVIRKDPKNAAAMFELANVYMDQKKYNDALFFSKSAFKIDPSNVWYGQQYAEVLQRNSRFKEAAEVLAKIVEEHPDEEDYYHQLAESYVFAGDAEQAIKTYDRLQERFGIDEETSMNKCRIYQQMKKPEKAITEMERLIRSDSTNVQAFAMLAELYQSTGNTEKALAAFQMIETIDPDNAFIHLSLADFYRTNGDKEKSFSELKLAFRNRQLEMDTKISILSSYYSLVTEHPELKEQATQLCDILVEVHPTDPRSHAAHADFLTIEKKYEEALAEYRRARELGSKEYSVYSQILLIESQLSDWDAMLKESEEALTLFPDQPAVYFFNGIAKQHAKRFADAITILNTGVNMVVDNPQLSASFYSAMGESYHELGDHVKSDQCYEKALTLDPKDATVMNNYAYFLSLRGDRLTKAEELSKRSNELEPNSTSFEDTYGWIMFTMGKYADAKTWIGKSLEHGGDKSGVVLEHYGDVLYKLGELQQAMEYWQRAKQAGDASDRLDQKILQKKYIE